MDLRIHGDPVLPELEGGTACYGGHILAPAEGFGIRPRFVGRLGKKLPVMQCFGSL